MTEYEPTIEWQYEHRSALQVIVHESDSRGGIAALARDCGVKAGTLRKIIRDPETLPKLDTALRIQKVTKLPLICLLADKLEPVRVVLGDESVRQNPPV